MLNNIENFIIASSGVLHLTADICKTIIGRGLEIVLMERAVNFT